MGKLKTVINKILISLITISLVVFSLISENKSVYGAVEVSQISDSGLIQQRIVDYAKEWVGVTPYVYRGASLEYGADCSGFVMKIYEQFGIRLPHGTAALLNIGQSVSWSEIQLGDVIITKSTSSPTGRHTGIYAGNGQWVNAQSTKTGTVLNNVKTDNIISIRRIIGYVTSDGRTPNFFPDGVGELVGDLLEGFKPKGEIDPKEVDLDGLEFEFTGNPSKMEYNGSTQNLKWLFSKFSQFIDYILGIMVQGVKGAIVGWTAIIEGMVNNILNLLNIDANYEEEKKYTIEDIVYNRVPIFDINVFSNTAGGQDIEDNSLIDTVRTVVATWYVAIRNVVVVLLVILLIYTGLRMAIATVASDKAKYKEFLLGWLKSIIILFTINLVMISVLNINSMLINMFSKGRSSESLMYETIRTRAYDFRFSIGIPGTIMYIALIIIFIRFVWLYIKRTFTVLTLIVLAPMISAKYAFDSASGKRSRVFSEWLYQFSANVLIQSVHALLYTSIVGISLDVSTENITGFIISLIFLNFMLSADKIALRIFKFDSHVQDIQKPFKKEENLEGLYYTYGTVKLLQKGAKGVGHKLKVLSYSPRLRKVKNATRNVRNRVANSIDDAILSLNNRTIDRMQDGAVNSGRSYGAVKNAINKRINSANRILILKKASRRRGSAGRVAKQTLKLRKDQKNTVFKSNYKFIKNDIKGIGSIILAVPVMVVNPAVGVGLLFSGKKDLEQNAKGQRTREYSLTERAANVLTLGQYISRTEQNSFNEKRNKKIDATMDTMLEVNGTMDKIEEKLGTYDADKKQEAKNVMKAQYMSGIGRVSKYMKDYMTDVGNINMDVANIDKTTQTEMVDFVVGIIERGSKLDNAQKSKIVSEINHNLRNNRYGDDKEKNMKMFATTIEKSVKSNIDRGNRFANEISLVNELETKNKKLYDSIYNTTEDETTQVIDIENYIDTL